MPSGNTQLISSSPEIVPPWEPIFSFARVQLAIVQGQKIIKIISTASRTRADEITGSQGGTISGVEDMS